MFHSYGVHVCLNAVTGQAGRPGCVLVRALEPVAGAEIMARRRGVEPTDRRLSSGPGNLTRALGITIADNGADLTRGTLTIAARDGRRFRVATGPRIGISRAADLPLRFWVAGHPAVSR